MSPDAATLSSGAPPADRVGVVADGTPLVRAGVVATLRAAGFASVTEAAGGAELVDLAGRHPDAVVVLGTLGDVPVAELVRRLVEGTDSPRVVVMLGRVTPEAIAELLSLGIDALVPRTVLPAELVDVVNRVAAGERVIDPAVLLVDTARDEEATEPSSLTAREREVLVLLSNGHSNREIASSLYVSLPTVKTHLAHIYAKLGAKNRNEALGRAVASGLL
jgi:DNA-binding NarL/FixJ family response regulator